jgi:hypothetical protein
MKKVVLVMLLAAAICPAVYAGGVAYGLEGSNLYRVDSSGAHQIAGNWSGLQGLVGLGDGTAMGYISADATHDYLYRFSATGAVQMYGQYNVTHMVGNGDGTASLTHDGAYTYDQIYSIDPTTTYGTGTAGSWNLNIFEGNAGKGALAGDGSVYGREGTALYRWIDGVRTTITGNWGGITRFAAAGDGKAYGIDGTALRYFNQNTSSGLAGSWVCNGLVGAGSGKAYLLEDIVDSVNNRLVYITPTGTTTLAGVWNFSILEGAGNSSLYGLEGTTLSFFNGTARTAVAGSWTFAKFVGAGGGDAYAVEGTALKHFDGATITALPGTWNFDTLVGAGVAVPEPATVALLSFGGLLFFRRKV